jgi:zinc D-Ala-D-Ala carboxypeptidase
VVKRKKPKAKPLIAIAALILVAGIAAYLSWPNKGQSVESTSPQAGGRESGDDNAGETGQSFDKAKYSIDDPASLWVVVNKGRKLPSTYQPDDLMYPDTSLRYSSGSEMQLRADAASAIKRMFSAASGDGIKLMVASGYRRYVNEMGQAEAEKISARPGHSEHQTGLAVDVAPTSGQCLLEECFGDLADGKWVAEKAHLYGFIIRYPKGKEKQTGYGYEPWHLRYIGKELAGEVTEADQTLEQFFGLPAYSSYSSEITQL